MMMNFKKIINDNGVLKRVCATTGNQIYEYNTKIEEIAIPFKQNIFERHPYITDTLCLKFNSINSLKNKNETEAIVIYEDDTFSTSYNKNLNENNEKAYVLIEKMLCGDVDKLNNHIILSVDDVLKSYMAEEEE